MPRDKRASHLLFGQARQHQRLSQDSILQIGKRLRFVLGVSIRQRIFNAGDDDLSVREGLLELRNEGNRTTNTNIDRLHAPSISEGLLDQVRNWGINIGKVAGAKISIRNFDTCTEGGVLTKVLLNRVHCLTRVDTGNRAHRQTEANVRNARIR